MEDFKLIEEKVNPLFNRKEIVFEVSSEVTPSRKEVGDLIVKEFSTNLDNMKIKKILGKFGSKNFKVNVFIYNSEEEKNQIEPKRKKDELLKEEPKKEEKPIEKTPEEKEVKEEPEKSENNKEQVNEETKTEENKKE